MIDLKSKVSLSNILSFFACVHWIEPDCDRSSSSRSPPSLPLSPSCVFSSTLLCRYPPPRAPTISAFLSVHFSLHDSFASLHHSLAGLFFSYHIAVPDWHVTPPPPPHSFLWWALSFWTWLHSQIFAATLFHPCHEACSSFLPVPGHFPLYLTLFYCLFLQMWPPRSRRSSSFRSYDSAAFSSTSCPTRWATWNGRKWSGRRWAKWWSTSPTTGMSSQSPSTQRWCTWSVELEGLLVLRWKLKMWVNPRPRIGASCGCGTEMVGGEVRRIMGLCPSWCLWSGSGQALFTWGTCVDFLVESLII